MTKKETIQDLLNEAMSEISNLIVEIDKIVLNDKYIGNQDKFNLYRKIGEYEISIEMLKTIEAKIFR